MCNGISLRPDDHPESCHGSVSFCPPPCAVKQRSLSYISFEGVIYINCDNRFAHLHWWRRDLRSTLTSPSSVSVWGTLLREYIYSSSIYLYRSLIYMDHGVITVRFRSLAVHIFIRWRLLGLAWIQRFISCPCTRIEPKCAERVDLFKQRSSSPSLSWWTWTGCGERLSQVMSWSRVFEGLSWHSITRMDCT